MSRVCITNLPKHITPKRLREHFGVLGDITDCVVVRRKDEPEPEGENAPKNENKKGNTKPKREIPRMAFLGFKDASAGENAIKQFNDTYIDTSKIRIEAAKPAQSSNLGKCRSKNTQRKLERDRVRQKLELERAKMNLPESTVAAAKAAAEGYSDPKFQEFLQVVGHAKLGSWQNDLAIPAPSEVVTEQPTEIGGDTAEAMELDSKPAEPTAEEFHAKQQALNDLSDLDFLKSLKDPSSDEKQGPENVSEPVPHRHPLDCPPTESGTKQIPPAGSPLPVAEAAAPEEPVQSTRIYITNLPYTATEDELEKHFAMYGPVQQAHVPLTRDTKQSKGVGYVVFHSPLDCERAVKEGHGGIFQGRIINVTVAKQQPAPIELEWGNSYKHKKAMNEKKDRENTQRWSGLYIHHNTVVDTIAKRLNVGKDALVGKDQTDIAAKMAIAESVLTQEAKITLSEEGVNMAALGEKNRVNSKTIILVKNLPSVDAGKGADVLNELIKMFRSAGELGRVVAPPGTTLAMIEFLDANDARRAFSRFAYSPFRGVPLYLEWAPMGLLKEKQAENQASGAEDSSFTVYLTNIPLNETEANVRKMFRHLSLKIRSLTLKGDKGYAFVEFGDHSTAAQALQVVNGAMLNGRTLTATFAKSKPSTKPFVSDTASASTGVSASQDTPIGDAPPGKNPLKLIVKNVPFEATRSDLMKIFSAHASVKDVRLPMKVTEYHPETGTKAPHRGFAFLEFLTKEEAKNALGACKHIHLYGRHLVLDYAVDDSSVDAARAKATKRSLADVAVVNEVAKSLKSLKRMREEEFFE